MTALWVILIILAVFVLLSLIRIGAEVRYNADGFTAWARVLCFRFQVFPTTLTQEQQAKKAEKHRKKAAKKAAKAAKKPQPEEQEKGGLLRLFLAALPDIAKAVRKLFRKIRIDRLDVRLVWGASNPADAALGYGRASAAMGIIWGVLGQNFNVRDPHLSCYVDFDASGPTVTAHAQVTLTVGQAAAIVVPLLLQALKARSRQGHTADHKLTKEA